MQDYSLALALFDYLPVFASALGFYWLARLISSDGQYSKLALLGWALVISGGLCKASWKLIWVVTQQDLVWLANLLFILMAPGMIILAAHTLRASRIWRGTGSLESPNLWAFGLIAAVSAAAIAAAIGGGRSWFFIMLAGASVANIFLTSLLIRAAWGMGERTTALLFLLSISLIIGLSGLSRISEGSAPLQWLAECLNLVAQSSFAYAIFRLRPHILNLDTTVSSSKT